MPSPSKSPTPNTHGRVPVPGTAPAEFLRAAGLDPADVDALAPAVGALVGRVTAPAGDRGASDRGGFTDADAQDLRRFVAGIVGPAAAAREWTFWEAAAAEFLGARGIPPRLAAEWAAVALDYLAELRVHVAAV